MANGPFDSYAPPGVYTQTRVRQQASGPPTGNRIPVLIGVGRETLSQIDLELVRGSSASVDQRIVNEDVDDRFILDNSDPNNPILGSKDGSTAKFRVQNYPVVSGDGRGATTDDPQNITVTVDGELVSPAALDGSRGVVTLQVPPSPGSEVRVTYFFNREDTQITDDLSAQVTDDPAVLKGSKVETYDVVSGTNDVLELTVDGASASITLTTGTGRTAANIANDINAASVTGLTASVDANNQGDDRLQLEADGSLTIGNGTANTLLGFRAGQTTGRNRTFFTFQAPIVDGSNGGITTTDPSDVTVFVDGSQVVPEEVDGQNGAVTLEFAPPVGSTVEVRYFFNTWQDTFDYLPNTGIRNVERVGISPGRQDYIEGNDYVVDENGRILWGSAVTIEPGEHTAGTEFLDDTQITATLIDNRIYLEEIDRFVDRTTSPAQESDTVVVLGNTPTLGNGRNTPLDADLYDSLANERVGVPTHRTDLVKVYHGSTVSEAIANGPVTLTDVNPSNRRVEVEDPIPPDHTVWATYYYSRLQDDELSFEVLTQSTSTTPGQYEIRSDVFGETLFDVQFGTKSGAFTVQWPSGVEDNPDAFITGTSGVNETVTVTFTEVEAAPAIYTNDEAGPYSLYANASDTLDINVSGTDYTIDFNTAAYGVIVSGEDDDGSYSLTAGTNDVFEYELDGSNYSVTVPDTTSAGADIAEYIWRSAPNETEVQGSQTEDFDLDQGSSGVAYDVDINGTNVANTYTGGATDDAATAAAAIASDIETASGTLTAGPITDPANDFNVVANTDGTVSIVASESLTINDGGGGAGADLEDVFGWDGGTQVNVSGSPSYTETTALTNTKIAEYRDNRFFLRSRVTPTGPGDESVIGTLDGSINDTIGFDDFQDAEGTEAAVNKAATLLSDSISSSGLTSLGNASSADFIINVDGVESTIDLTTISAPISVADVASAIDTAISGTAVVEDTDKIRITSSVDTNLSRIEVRDGSGNQYIGFTEGDRASQRRPSAGELAAVLNNDLDSFVGPSSGFAFDAFADTYTVAGEGEFLRLTTLAEGATASFTLSSGTDTILNDTGIGIEDGDSAAGADALDGFDVTSSRSDNLGSGGSGLVGQTYTDDQTGLRFTVLESGSGDYSTGNSFTLVVSDTLTTGSGTVVRAVPGVEVTVDNTTDVGVGDTALLTTYNKTGAEPEIGDFYYVSYQYEKSDFSTQLFTRFRDIQDNYGELSPENPLTLASYLAILNGAVIVGCKQVLKTGTTNQATSQSYLDALDELRRPLQAGITPDLLVPLTSDPDVMGAYVQHAEIQSSQRFRQERRCLFGVASGTRPSEARSIAEGLNSERAILLYPDSAIITLNNELGEPENFIVDGTYIAAAMAGTLVNPAFDVATPLTRRQVTGFSRLNRSLDEIEKNQLAVSGVTVLEDRGTSLQVRDGLTTNVSTRFTSTPSIIAIQDFVQQQSRAALDRFIGLKFITGRAQDVEVALTGLLNSLVEQQIIVDFQGVRAEPDPDDPTMLRVSAFYAPVFPLKYIPITFTISSSNSL